MKILSIPLAIILPIIAFSSPAFGYEAAALNSRGDITDENGKVVAVRNNADSRNNKYEYYYSPVDANGNVSSGSRYMLTTNPENPLAGYVKYDLTTESPGQPGQSTATAEPTQQPQSNGMVQNYGSTTSYNNENLNKARYDQDYKLEPIYK